jgi:hypothetical protein
MTPNTWLPQRRQQPAIRKQPTACPYCGDDSLILSWGDDAKNLVRIELYCKNEDCEAREITIVAETRGAAPARADLDRRSRATPSEPRRPRGKQIRGATPRKPGEKRIRRAWSDTA